MKIERFLDDGVREYLLRLGITEGSVVRCIHRLGRGPVVIRRNGLELSLGHRLAAGILVSGTGEDE